MLGDEIATDSDEDYSDYPEGYVDLEPSSMDEEGAGSDIDGSEWTEESDLESCISDGEAPEPAAAVVLPDPQVYPLRTTVHHFQAADALCCPSDLHLVPGAADGMEIVVTEGQSVRIYRVLAGEVHAAAPMLLGRLDLPFEPYSVVRYQSVVAVGGDRGLLTMFSFCGGVISNVVHLALSGLGHASTTNMVNSIRFGLVAGQMRLLVASQIGLIFLFELPKSEQIANDALGCATLPPAAASAVWAPAMTQLCKQMQVHILDCTPATWAGTALRVRHTVATYAIKASRVGRLGTALNCAVASPNGNWIAAVGDQPEVYLICQTQPGSGQIKTLPFGDKHGRPLARLTDRDEGSQYCCFNANSTIVAATSDASTAVLLWTVAAGQLIMSLTDHRRPCLPILFSLTDPNLLVYGEEATQVYACIVDQGGLLSRQRISIPREEVAIDSFAPRRRINGLALGPDNRVLVATKNQIMAWRIITQWTAATHHLFPAEFKAATQTLLLAGCKRHQTGGPDEQPGLQSVPQDVLLAILSFAALPLAGWMKHVIGDHI